MALPGSAESHGQCRRAFRPFVMAREDGRCAGERAQRFRERAREEFGGAAQPGMAARAAGHQRVTGEQETVREQAERAGRMPGRMQERNLFAPQHERVAVAHSGHFDAGFAGDG
jgi:hypothetical protein